MDCCRPVWEGQKKREWVSCVAFVDPAQQASWIFDATPNFPDQLRQLTTVRETQLQGVFLTHAHIGHYTGLIHLGREVMGTESVPVYAMPKMKAYLEENGPWSQLVALENIQLDPLEKGSSRSISSSLTVTPLQVPHRDEYSETVGYSIQGPQKKALFIPDIDKWELWEHNIDSVIQQHDLAFLDGSFFANGEIPGRDMSAIPHPFIEESLARFKQLAPEERNKIHFIHFNHTNPVLSPESEASKQVQAAGMHISRSLQEFAL